MITRCNKCCYMNHYNNSCNSVNNAIEEKCKDNICSYVEDNHTNNCQCGFYQEYNVFPSNPMLAQSYVPIQNMGEVFTPCCGLENGTIFPELVTTYCPGDSMNNIEYLRIRNTIGEGCNKCS